MGGKASAIGDAIDQMIEPIVTLLNAQEFTGAEAALKELLAASPEHAEGLHLYGLLLSQTGREEQGIAALRKATERAPAIALYWNNLAAAYSRHQEWDASVAAARKATELDPNYAEPQHILTNILLSQGKTEAGTDELAKLVTLRGGDAKLWLLLARSRNEQQRHEEAEVAYRKALELSPDDATAMRELASVYMNTWRYDEARRLRQKADELDAAAGH
ncbi:MAG TPA: tetratricopeptide repeat protein [Dongiaceae bacterium]|nr:tetratricopeptide repeat protein [Dongiaceae bacterium]